MKILLVDDEIAGLRATGDFLKEMGHVVTEFADPRLALEIYLKDYFPLVLSDVKMPTMSGLDLLREIKASPRGADTLVVLFTGFGDAEGAAEAIRTGAYDFLLKPFDVAELAGLIERIESEAQLSCAHGRVENQTLGHAEISDEVRLLRKVLASYMVGDELVFRSPTMLSIVDQAKRYHRDPDIPVLITGETGTGKEVISRLIHFGEGETNAPYIDINCAAITPSLFESEIFGYEGGAFTGGRVKGQKGKLDLAAGGTLFLDEVAELPIEMQGKLLRVLQEKYFYRVGGLEKIPFRARLICATNVKLEQAVHQGLFRKDLYFRLAVGNIEIPPLRERKADIVPLADIFLQKYAREKKKKFKHINELAADALMQQEWTGNIREMKNLIEWAVFMFDEEELRIEHIYKFFQRNLKPNLAEQLASRSEISIDCIRLPEDAFDLEDHIAKVVKSALHKFDNNKAKTARYLRITRRSLYGILNRMEQK